jgi:hypothetical protein
MRLFCSFLTVRYLDDKAVITNCGLMHPKRAFPKSRHGVKSNKAGASCKRPLFRLEHRTVPVL